MTMKSNWCAIITNGTAILGFGDIGATAGMPVMEGKSCIFKALGDVDVVPMCI
jgi:malate dehydrogenase (oxaloacetate-decarboxylating)